MLPTIRAPTNTTSKSPKPVRKRHTNRSLRQNKPSTAFSVAALTEYRAPGMARAAVRRPVAGTWTR